METCLWEQRRWPTPFPSLAPQHIHRATCKKQHSMDTGCLICLHQAPHINSLHPSGTALLNHTCLSLSMAGPSPQRPAQIPACTTSSDQKVLEGFSSGGGGQVSLHKQTRTHLVKTHYTLWPRSKYSPLQARRNCRGLT